MVYLSSLSAAAAVVFSVPSPWQSPGQATREREREMKQSKLRTSVPMNLRLRDTKERHSG